jgi:hypothetical protein
MKKQFNNLGLQTLEKKAAKRIGSFFIRHYMIRSVKKWETSGKMNSYGGRHQSCRNQPQGWF